MKYVIVVLLTVAFLALCAVAKGSDEAEFNEWFGVHDAVGDKYIATFSGSQNYELQVFIDDKNIHRLRFHPKKKIRLATFDHRHYTSMNFNSLYGFDHWIRRMKKHYRLQVYFEGEDRYEVFSLKGFYKAERWLFK